tara:strand:- start:457 stop:1425 length:969 start_codon:yes stop_codon:yes gene_type:complete
MNKYKKIYGVDISKDSFDVVDNEGNHDQYGNEAKGFLKFKKLLDADSLVVMEATGYYHYSLAQFLSASSIPCSVVNPLSVKRFVQMKLAKVKTDKADAAAICAYAQVTELSMYSALKDTQAECLQIYSLLEHYEKKRTAIKNKLHGEKTLGKPSKAVYQSLNRVLKVLKVEITLLEQQLVELVKQEHSSQLKLLKSIPGIGIKTALFLIVVTNGFSKFETASQLCSYAGITPTERRSGTSIRGRSRISKVGNKRLRHLLFMCSFSACKYNLACNTQFKRIVAKGKSEKLALLAVSNKLLRQSFAIVKSGIPYDASYCSTLIS